jgi:hypothetical protein
MEGRTENRATGFNIIRADPLFPSDYPEDRSSTFLRNFKLSHILAALSPTNTITVDLNPVNSFPQSIQTSTLKMEASDSADTLTLHPITNGSTTSNEDQLQPDCTVSEYI